MDTNIYSVNATFGVQMPDKSKLGVPPLHTVFVVIENDDGDYQEIVSWENLTEDDANKELTSTVHVRYSNVELDKDNSISCTLEKDCKGVSSNHDGDIWTVKGDPINNMETKLGASCYVLQYKWNV